MVLKRLNLPIIIAATTALGACATQDQHSHPHLDAFQLPPVEKSSRQQNYLQDTPIPPRVNEQVQTVPEVDCYLASNYHNDPACRKQFNVSLVQNLEVDPEAEDKITPKEKFGIIQDYKTRCGGGLDSAFSNLYENARDAEVCKEAKLNRDGSWVLRPFDEEEILSYKTDTDTFFQQLVLPLFGPRNN